MRLKIVWVVLLLSACARESPEVGFAKLESIRLEQYANIARQEGECRAVAIEFKHDPVMDANCQETLKMTRELAARTIADAAKREAELHTLECSKVGGRFGGIPVDC